MKKLGIALLTTFLNLAPALAQVGTLQATSLAPHGGGNGGDDMELELKKKSLQIGYFLKSETGKSVFKVLNSEAVLEAIEKTDIDVVTGNVVDKYGTIRTCVNESERSLITCNLDRLNQLKLRKQNDVLTAILFHEILGIMGLELGYQENVSMYPISSKIMPYSDIIDLTPISEANIRPEYFGLDSRGYGVTLINKETNETVRMICLNSNVEIHRCRNYSLVRNANNLQAPLINGIVSISPAKLAAIKLENLKTSDLKIAEAKLSNLKSKGFKFISLKGTIDGDYRYGTGLAQYIQDGDNDVGGYIMMSLIGITEVDTVVEASKQLVNTGIWPIKALINSIKVLSIKGKINKANDKLNTAKNVLNLSNELNLVGTSKKVSDEEFKQIIEIINLAVKN